MCNSVYTVLTVPGNVALSRTGLMKNDGSVYRYYNKFCRKRYYVFARNAGYFFIFHIQCGA